MEGTMSLPECPPQGDEVIRIELTGPSYEGLDYDMQKRCTNEWGGKHATYVT